MGDWVNIYTARNILDANFIKGRLESEDIPAMLKYEVAGQLYGITVDGLSEVQIFVPRELQQEAIEIIDQLKQGQEEL